MPSEMPRTNAFPQQHTVFSERPSPIGNKKGGCGCFSFCRWGWSKLKYFFLHLFQRTEVECLLKDFKFCFESTREQDGKKLTEQQEARVREALDNALQEKNYKDVVRLLDYVPSLKIRCSGRPMVGFIFSETSVKKLKTFFGEFEKWAQRKVKEKPTQENLLLVQKFLSELSLPGNEGVSDECRKLHIDFQKSVSKKVMEGFQKWMKTAKLEEWLQVLKLAINFVQSRRDISVIPLQPTLQIFLTRMRDKGEFISYKNLQKFQKLVVPVLSDKGIGQFFSIIKAQISSRVKMAERTDWENILELAIDVSSPDFKGECEYLLEFFGEILSQGPQLKDWLTWLTKKQWSATLSRVNCVLNKLSNEQKEEFLNKFLNETLFQKVLDALSQEWMQEKLRCLMRELCPSENMRCAFFEKFSNKYRPVLLEKVVSLEKEIESQIAFSEDGLLKVLEKWEELLVNEIERDIVFLNIFNLPAEKFANTAESVFPNFQGKMQGIIKKISKKSETMAAKMVEQGLVVVWNKVNHTTSQYAELETSQISSALAPSMQMIFKIVMKCVEENIDEKTQSLEIGNDIDHETVLQLWGDLKYFTESGCGSLPFGADQLKRYTLRKIFKTVINKAPAVIHYKMEGNDETLLAIAAKEKNGTVVALLSFAADKDRRFWEYEGKIPSLSDLQENTRKNTRKINRLTPEEKESVKRYWEAFDDTLSEQLKEMEVAYAERDEAQRDYLIKHLAFTVEIIFHLGCSYPCDSSGIRASVLGKTLGMLERTLLRGDSALKTSPIPFLKRYGNSKNVLETVLGSEVVDGARVLSQMSSDSPDEVRVKGSFFTLGAQKLLFYTIPFSNSRKNGGDSFLKTVRKSLMDFSPSGALEAEASLRLQHILRACIRSGVFPHETKVECVYRINNLPEFWKKITVYSRIDDDLQICIKKGLGDVAALFFLNWPKEQGPDIDALRLVDGLSKEEKEIFWNRWHWALVLSAKSFLEKKEIEKVFTVLELSLKVMPYARNKWSVFDPILSEIPDQGREKNAADANLNDSAHKLLCWHCEDRTRVITLRRASFDNIPVFSSSNKEEYRGFVYKVVYAREASPEKPKQQTFIERIHKLSTGLKPW